MRRNKLIWKILPPYILLALFALAAPSFIAAHYIRTFYIDSVKEDLFSRAYLMRDDFAGAVIMKDASTADRLCKELGKASKTRITVIALDGVVLGDSDGDPRNMENHKDRPEIIAALGVGKGFIIRYSETLKKRIVYSAVPVKHNGKNIGVVRAALPVESIESFFSAANRKALTGGLLVVVLGAFVSIAGYMRIAVPLDKLKRKAEDFSKGRLSGGKLETEITEIKVISEVMDAAARQLDERMRTVMRQRNELEAVLSSMVEGLIAVDGDRNIININKAACVMLELNREDDKNRNIAEVITTAGMIAFIERSLEGNGLTEEEFTLPEPPGRILEAHGKPLEDGMGSRIGALIVINEVTRLRKLENLRREFVANVSHELKTPLTSMKGAVENLLGGAIENKEDAARFLGIIEKHTDRMNKMINDLLRLSKLDQGEGAEQLDLEEVPIKAILSAAARESSLSASRKNITINIDCSDRVTATVNGGLLELAAANLIDNAIKHSESGSNIDVKCCVTREEIAISVTDRGTGIQAEHIPRLFERFYRVEHSRNSETGGAGLGLAIVKKIAQAHGGRAGAASEPGKGSVFSIYIPVNRF